MGRRTEKIDYISNDVMMRLKVYCNGDLGGLFLSNVEFRGLGIQTFYEIMRGGCGTAINVKRFEDLDKQLMKDGTYKSISLLFGE
jgi:hypothetical protein